MTTMGSQGAQVVLQIVGLAVLARLLTPADYGLIGMVMVVVNFASMFADAGLSMATVQKDEISFGQISTLFWVNVIISVALGFGILAVSPLVAVFYRRPELTAVTAGLSLTFLLSGLAIQHQALLRRHMCFGALAVIQLGSRIVSLVVTIVLAICGWRYWALVGGTLTNALLIAVLTFVFCPWIPGRMQRGTGAHNMIKFGGHLTAFNVINFFSRNADSILIGRCIGYDALGLYTRAYQLFLMPISQIRTPLTNVATPVLSSLTCQPERYLRYYQRLMDVMAALTVPLALYCVVEADFVITLLLGKAWIGAVPVFRILAITGAIQSTTSTAGLVQLTFGHSARYLKWGVASMIVFVGSFLVGLPFGIVGVATSYTCANVLITFPTLFYCYHGTPVPVSSYVKAVFPPLMLSTGALGVAIALKELVGDSLLSHLLSLCVFLVLYITASCYRAPIRDLIRLVMKNSSHLFPKPNTPATIS